MYPISYPISCHDTLQFGTKGKLRISMNCTLVTQYGRLWKTSVVSKQNVVSDGRFMSLTRIYLSSTVHKAHVHTVLVLMQTIIDRLAPILLHMNQKTGYFTCWSLSSHYIGKVADLCHVLHPSEVIIHSFKVWLYWI
jgi:hypothetical protein